VNGFFVTGTDTDVGKTLVAAWLLTQLDASYWKPVQAGVMPETDSSVVRRLAEIEPDRILPEAYVLPEAIAPHEAARAARGSRSTWRSSFHPFLTGRLWSRAPVA
jgi:dethiobiotin synthetase